jgi:glucosamine-6-phosphate deaminase
LQYFKSIEKVAKEAGFEQILPSKVRTGNGVVPKTRVEEVNSPTILSPQPTTSRLLRATPATEYPVRSVSPDLIPDRMASRIPEPALNKRLTPNPEQQAARQNAISA